MGLFPGPGSGSGSGLTRAKIDLLKRSIFGNHGSILFRVWSTWRNRPRLAPWAENRGHFLGILVRRRG